MYRWIGLHRILINNTWGNFTWSDGTAIDYTNWCLQCPTILAAVITTYDEGIWWMDIDVSPWNAMCAYVL